MLFYGQTRIFIHRIFCRISDTHTSRPVQDCIENYELYNGIRLPLLMNEKYDLFVADVADNEFESMSVAFKKTTLVVQ